MTISHSQVVANNFPNLRTIQFMLFTLDSDRDPFNVCAILLCEDLADSIILQINILAKLNHLQTIIINTPSITSSSAGVERVTRIKSAKRVLTQIQLRDNLEKTVVVRDYEGNERRILISFSSFGSEDVVDGD